jgi:hypothetical protein
MIPILIDGELNPEIAGDPRWSQSQTEQALKAARLDERAGIVGMDSALRPVVTTMVRRQRVQYALLRNGAPTEAKRITERWNRFGKRAAA